jgi:hypothetical protein
MSLTTSHQSRAVAAWAWLAAHFPGRRRVSLAVVPTTDETPALSVVTAARDSGADGVFLVNAGIGHQKLLRIASGIAQRCAGFFVGVNCLDLRPQDVFCRLTAGVAGVWSRTPGLLPFEPAVVAAIADAYRASAWRGLFFAQIDPAALLGANEANAEALKARILQAMAALERAPTIITVDSGGCYAHGARATLSGLRRAVAGFPWAVVLPRPRTASRGLAPRPAERCQVVVLLARG